MGKRGRILTMDMAIFEGSDYFLDLETNSYNKKRRRGEALATAQDDNADEDYVSFLDGLQQFWEAKFVEDDDVDPTYMEFLENLKEHKNAYMCDVSIENGVLSPIYYEYKSPNPKKRKTPQPHNGTGIRKKRNLYQNAGLKSSQKISGLENNSCDVLPKSLDVAENQKSGWKNSKARNVHLDGPKRKTPVSCVGDLVKESRSVYMIRDQKSSDSRNNHHDGISKVHSDGVKRRDPISHKGDRVRENRSLYRDRDKKFSDSRNDHHDWIKRNTPQPCQVDHLGENRSLDMGSDQNNSDSENDFSHRFKQKTPHSSKGDSVGMNRILDMDSDHISGPKYSGAGKKTSTVIDETYEKFLNSLQFTKDSVFYENGDQERIFYEPNDNQTTCFEIKKCTRPPSTLRPSTPIPRPQTPPSRAKITSHKKPTPTDSLNLLSMSTCKIGKKSRVSSSSYWKKELHDYLRKPYQRKEYDELWAELDSKKPVSIYRDSRSGGSYRPGHMGKSLLEKHPDLQREIQKVQSNHLKVLNLLRMCRFYLQKVPSIPSGVCEPWKDELTMNILPRSS